MAIAKFSLVFFLLTSFSIRKNQNLQFNKSFVHFFLIKRKIIKKKKKKKLQKSPTMIRNKTQNEKKKKKKNDNDNDGGLGFR
jgi:hypothetical protein